MENAVVVVGVGIVAIDVIDEVTTFPKGASLERAAWLRLNGAVAHTRLVML